MATTLLPPYQPTNNDVLIEHVAGSTLYQLNVSTSDVDMRGVFCVPREYRLFQHLTYNTEHSASEVSIDGQDHKLYELTHFLQLVLKQNPTIMETVTISVTDPNVTRFKQVWNDVMGNYITRPGWININLVRGLLGYANQQLTRGLNLHTTKDHADGLYQMDPEKYQRRIAKYYMHIARLLHQARILMETGEFLVVLPQEIRSELLDIRTMSNGFDTFNDVNNHITYLYEDISARYAKLKEHLTHPLHTQLPFHELVDCATTIYDNI